jgi:hypothetical protein
VDSDFRTIALSTSEEPIWQKVSDASGRQARVRGEEVRMINIRACVSDHSDIFDGASATTKVGRTLNERIRFVEELEQLASKYQGQAFRRYIARLVKDRCARKKLTQYVDVFVQSAALPNEQRWLGRIRRRFALLYAAAALAIDYKSCPGASEKPLRRSNRA